jgi:hypothetical protein
MAPLPYGPVTGPVSDPEQWATRRQTEAISALTAIWALRQKSSISEPIAKSLWPF